MNAQEYRNLKDVATRARDNFEHPERLFAEIQRTAEAIVLLESTPDPKMGPNYELKLEYRNFGSMIQGQFYEVPGASWDKKKTKLSTFVLPALKAYLAQLEKEFAAL